MKQKGFTLIEILAVIVVIGLILVIAVPKVLEIIQENKQRLYDSQISLIKETAQKYIVRNSYNIEWNNNQAVIFLSDLIDNGLIKPEIDNPLTGDIFDYDLTAVQVTKSNTTEAYSYLVQASINCGLTAQYNLDGDAIDFSSNANNGTVTGATATTNRFGGSGKAMYFDNIGDYISFPNLEASTSYSASFWIKPAALTGTGENATLGFSILGGSVAPGYLGMWITYYNEEINAIAFSASTAGNITSGASVGIDEWTNVTVTAIKGGVANIYINGILSKTFNAGNVAWDGSFTIGDLRPTRAIYFYGSIDDVRMYNRILTSTEITALLNLE